MLNDLKTQFSHSMQTMRRLLQQPIAADESARSPRSQAREERRQRVRRMRRDLYQLLEQHPASRELMRHLDLVERTLRVQGLTAVEALPARVIAKALVQLERLVWDWSPVGLAELRSRLAVIVRNQPIEVRAPAAPLANPPAPTPIARSIPQELVEVSEVDHATFEEMERSWHGRVPEAPSAAQAA
ncbi:MAG TPA: hypothetical protein VNU48_10755 [Burkholderiaceae bacterium]|nr:hypothetical protein [Burkholderiaceae bacterium]